jgi:ribose transport system substrate-binding protein
MSDPVRPVRASIAWVTVAVLVAAAAGWLWWGRRDAARSPQAQEHAHPDAGSVAGDPAQGRPPFRIGVLYWSDTIAGQVAMRRGLEAEAEAINRAGLGPGVTLVPRVAGDGESGRQRQIEQMESLIRAGVDAIIVQPTDNAALVGPLTRANAAGIPVVAYDQYVEGGRLAAYVTSDNEGAGRLDGEYVAHRFPDTQTLRIVLVEYPHVSSTVERLDGFIDALAERKQPYVIVGSYKAVEPVKGAEAGQAILRDFPERGSVDVVFTVNDGGGLAVVEALAAAGRDEIAVASIDGDPASVENIRKRRLTIIDAAQFCGPMGAAAMRAAYGVLTGVEVPPRQLISTFPITAETLDAYPGWMGPLPAAFQKPWPSRTPEWRPTQDRDVEPL